MKISAVFLLLLFVPLLISARHIIPSSLNPQGKTLLSDSEGRREMKEDMMRVETRKVRKRGETVEEVAGSRLPDCSHACGSCTPCRLVMVSFVCATLEEAETCPMAYKCMCHDKSYPVP
ncbi:protein EPIDERMAL PATTERNING FACTOR 1 [Prosopis cineraria]|uniref:protein EPIDERMAL PATTERNING FACTOR 1 n=1 Tax=Prosopis cineraria TaxID=364024 RepID=UPI002410A69E|nr:protein EPIDERMAL PATTERNING FACTOR 1 [Prosopis cineraria]